MAAEEDPSKKLQGARGVAVQFFLDGDLTDKSTMFVARQTEGMTLQLRQSHGWLSGTLDASSLEEAQRRYSVGNKHSWPRVFPDKECVCVDRHGTVLSDPELRVKMEDIRPAGPAVAPRLSALFVRWGGAHRLGEGCEPEDEGNGGWGVFGSPPSDWYIDAVVRLGLAKHPGLGGEDRDFEVLSLFLGSDAQVEAARDEAAQVAALLRGRSAASFWMLWPADFPSDWLGEAYVAYVNRSRLFAAQRALECARRSQGGHVRSAFPHPADLWEFITSKRWMATLSPRAAAVRLPACSMIGRELILTDCRRAARTAMAQLEGLRSANRGVWPDCGGPAAVNSRGLRRGVVKIGWSWEAKFVWFWSGEAQLAEYLRAMVTLPGCSAEFALVQEWVDFDFELRLFFFPPRDWTPGQALAPAHHEYTAWVNTEGADEPGTFLKPSEEEALSRFGGDAPALASAHAQAVEASLPLIAELLTKHAEPVPMIRMDWMLKRRGPGKAQVVFGEYCEMGACCLKWEEGPPRIWRAMLDFALAE